MELHRGEIIAIQGLAQINNEGGRLGIVLLGNYNRDVNSQRSEQL